MNNPFHNPAFSMAALSAAINIIPNRYGRMEALNLFPAPAGAHAPDHRRGAGGRAEPATGPAARFARHRGYPRQAHGALVRDPPHIPHDDVVLPEEVQGIRAFGSETEMESIAGVMARHLETMRNKHAITLESISGWVRSRA